MDSIKELKLIKGDYLVSFKKNEKFGKIMVNTYIGTNYLICFDIHGYEP
jgi:hypothetical protein